MIPFDEQPGAIAIALCYETLAEGTHKKEALRHADYGILFLNSYYTRYALTELEKKKCESGYLIIATAYLWNGLYKKAFALEKYFLYKKYFWEEEAMKQQIGNYIILLTIKEQLPHIKQMFEDHEFKKEFLSWYEAAVSLLENPELEFTNQIEFVIIANKMINGKSKYN